MGNLTYGLSYMFFRNLTNELRKIDKVLGLLEFCRNTAKPQWGWGWS